jgi:hypothetical protein
MFARWRQENFFKYLSEEYALDALVEYDTEPDDATRDVPNRVWHDLDAQYRKAKAELSALAAHYGLEAMLNEESERRTMRGFKIANAELGRGFTLAARRVVELHTARDAVPKRVPIGQIAKGEVVKLAVERRHLATIVKMVAYQAESDLCRLVEPYYARTEDEGRTLIQSALASAADIDVTDTELRVTLAPLSSHHRSKAIACLCTILNTHPVRFPGSRLTLHFAVAGQDD